MSTILHSHPLQAAAAAALLALLLLGFATWLASLPLRDVSIVDRFWPMLILLAALIYALALPLAGERPIWVLALTLLWAIRLATHITWRNWGEGEDRRYQQIRARNQPGFEWKSLYLVFGFQALLAWMVSLPLLAAISGTRPLNALDALGFALAMSGIVFETVADAQLAGFKSRPENRDRVMNRGLWRYSRHPNYFGEFCVWWGFFLVAAASGAWWTIVSPLLMSLLLLRVSGVALLEKDIADRRPAYRDYILRTNAFFPWSPRA